MRVAALEGRRAISAPLLNPDAAAADAQSRMFELFAIYALLLGGWGLWHARRQAEPVAPPEVEPAVTTAVAPPAHERGAAARRHLSTLP